MPNVLDLKGNVVGQEPIPGGLSADFSEKQNAIFRAVFRELANPRAGTHSTLRRDDVRGGGRKPWKQKGTGRARQGSIRSPQWRHGGVVFGPHPRSYVSSLNKKERRLALVAALANRFQSDAVSVLETASFDLTKTKDFATMLFGTAAAAKNGPTTLIVFAAHESELGEKLARVGGNLQRVGITSSNALDVKDVLGFTRMILTRQAFDSLSKALKEAE